MRGEFSPWRRLWRCGAQTGSGVGKTQHHGVAVGHEDIAYAVGAWAGREQCKAAPEERMGGIDDLDFRRIVYRWVVDRGIKVFNRNIFRYPHPGHIWGRQRCSDRDTAWHRVLTVQVESQSYWLRTWLP